MTTSQRGGEWFENVELIFDKETESYSLGQSDKESNFQKIRKSILSAVENFDEPAGASELNKIVGVKSETFNKALRELRDGREIGFTGTGNRGNAFKYFFLNNDFPIPSCIGGEAGTVKSIGGDNE